MWDTLDDIFVSCIRKFYYTKNRRTYANKNSIDTISKDSVFFKSIFGIHVFTNKRHAKDYAKYISSKLRFTNYKVVVVKCVGYDPMYRGTWMVWCSHENHQKDEYKKYSAMTFRSVTVKKIIYRGK